MRRARVATLVALALLAPATPHPGAAARQAAPGPSPGDRLAGYADQGSFARYYRDQVWGAVAFRWDSSGRFESHPVRGRPGLGGENVRIDVDSTGRWCRVDVGLPGDSVFLERVGTVAVLHGESGIDSFPLPAGTLLHGPPGLLDQVPRAYDRRRGGLQKISALILPLHLREATIEPFGRVTRRVAGRLESFDRFRYTLHRMRLLLWVDRHGRVVLADEPDQTTGWVREGFEVLRATPGGAARRDTMTSRRAPAWRDTLRPARDSIR